MRTQCSPTEMYFGRAGGRRVVADFDGGMVSSDAGALLLGEAGKAIELTDRFAACFVDRRNPLMTVHALRALVAQRVFGLALGYEDLNDHDDLRGDPVLGVLLGKLDRPGEGSRAHIRERGYKIGVLVALGEVTDKDLGPDPFTERSKEAHHTIRRIELRLEVEHDVRIGDGAVK